MNNYSKTYSHLEGCVNSKVYAKYVVNNLVMCENRVNTHTHTHTYSHRAYFTNYFLNTKELAKSFFPILLPISLDAYLRNGAPPLRVAVQEALHHHTALQVGTHRALSVMPFFCIHQ